MAWRSSGVIGALDLLDRPRRQPQIDRAAGLVAQPVALGGCAVAVPLDVVEREGEDHGELVDEGRLERSEPVLRHADQRLGDRLMRAALGRERHARRRRHQNEAGVLVAGVVQRIEPAGDERIVERADRQQPLAVDRMRQAERRQQDEQIHLGDAELDVLALGRELPVEGRGDAFAFERVGHALAREQAAAVDPWAEIGRDRDVGRGGDDALGERRLLARQLVEQRAEAELRRHLGLDRHRRALRAPGFAAPSGGVRRLARTAPCRGTPAPARASRAGLRTGPIRARANVHRLPEGLHLRRRHQAGVVVLVAGDRQAEALDRVGDEAGRPVVIDLVEGFDDRRQVVAAEIVHQPRQLVVGALLDQLRHRALIADLVEQALAPRRAALEHQRRVELVRTAVDPLPQTSRRPARGTRPAAASRISGSPRPSRNS